MLDNILIIGDYSRKDILSPFKLLIGKINMYFLTYYSAKELPSRDASQYGTILFWNEYSSGLELIKKLKIKKIIFYEYETFNNIALRAAAKQLGIRCYHLEHGYRDYGLVNKVHKNKQKVKKIIYKIPFVSYIKLFFISRFYYNTYKKCNNELKKQLLKFYKTRSSYGILSTFKKIDSPLLKLDFYINFSSENFKYFRTKHHLKDNFKHFKLIGFPQFDNASLAAKSNLNFNSNKLLFIDQPFLEQNLFGWTPKHKFSFLTELQELATTLKLKLIIKPHPINDNSFYDNLDCEIITENIFDNYSYSYVIGFNSTLLFPLATIPNTLLICLNNHPEPFQSIENNIFVKNKVAIGLNQLSDLSKKSLKIKVLAKDRKSFVKKYLYKFDGRSKSRLTKIILSS